MHRCAVHPLPCTPKLPHAPGTAVAMAVAASPPCSRCRICISIPSSCTFSRQKVPGAANQPPQLHWLHLQPAANIAQMTPVTWTSSGITSIVPLGFFFHICSQQISALWVFANCSFAVMCPAWCAVSRNVMYFVRGELYGGALMQLDRVVTVMGTRWYEGYLCHIPFNPPSPIRKHCFSHRKQKKKVNEGMKNKV